MKHDGYYNRALKANDPRYARVFGKLGYSRADLTSDDAVTISPAQADVGVPAQAGAGAPPTAGAGATPTADPDADLHALREQYNEAVGKRPFHGWDAATLASKIAEAQTN